ncbi:EAL domain, c-di-GMP-specific phosphodiesterase class I (or its enzymatically inactive variant) [Kosakonia arachidis]|uniref:EAL domain, c-di-GMP-specific phosphodiesterase class I (Or its enzymatically inactive variant) n=1 Tax=Kosakonia arachidis TaxID=551989 RepID=A0A1I7DKD3_9ENTR|nr:cyclic-guanylate-specific phosphodiesterase [Kosakonia arachidis]SFU12172.1 EAL domain, c-di-GMP-specific phosphodiesterase class I (or its enzymatically inactive variant) [Kosakonia arachidis]
MKLKQGTQWLNIPEASIESLEERRYWLQCERAYTYQPIYKTDGRLMAIEVLTIVTHPSQPDQRIAPDRYFSQIPVRLRVEVVHEQVELLAEQQTFFTDNDVLASVNVDGPTLLTMRENTRLMALIESLSWIRFELVEHIRLPQDSTFASISEIGPLWLDDFGTGMANFSALSEVRYDYIKVARDLFIMLRKTPEGQNLFTMLLQLMNRYCQGVIVEGVETLEEWRDVQKSPAFAAQGYFLSRPVPLARLEHVILNL